MRTLFLAALFSTAGGCIYYDGGAPCAECDWDADGDGWADDRPDGGDGDGDGVWTLSLDPDEIEAGAAMIASLTADGDLDVSEVVAVTVLGPVAVLEVEPRPSEALVVFEADATAAAGSYDLLIDLADGSTVVYVGALHVVAATGGGDTGSDCP